MWALGCRDQFETDISACVSREPLIWWDWGSRTPESFWPVATVTTSTYLASDPFLAAIIRHVPFCLLFTDWTWAIFLLTCTESSFGQDPKPREAGSQILTPLDRVLES